MHILTRGTILRLLNVLIDFWIFRTQNKGQNKNKIKDKNSIDSAETLNNIGVVYNKLGNYP